MSLLSPWSLVWLGAAAAIGALYFLKPRSRRLEVSSIWLWQGAVREESARTLIQWLKTHLLLLLQLLVALAAIFALARPAFTRTLPVGRTLVFAMDVSAPMLAGDGDPAALARQGGAIRQTVTRMDEARARALQLLGQLHAGDRVIVLRAADHAEVFAQGTLPADAAALRSAIARLPVAPAELNAADVLEVAGSLTRTARLGQVIFFTGGVVELTPAALEHRAAAAIEVVRVGRGEADNQAITALDARRNGAGELEVFARITNFATQPASGTIRFRVDGELFDERPVNLPAKQSQDFILSEFPPKAALIEARFERQGRPDLLALDNVSTAAVPVPLLRKVQLVGGRSDQLERALRSVPGVELSKIDPQQYTTRGGYDVYVFEGWFPPSPPPGHWVLVDPPARGGGLSGVNVTGTLGRRTDRGREVNEAQIARVLPSPLLRGVDLVGVSIVEAKKLGLPDWAEEVVSAREGPLVFMGYPRPYRAVVFAFDLRASNLFGRVGFPILVSNVVNWLTGDLSGSGETATLAGESRFSPGDTLLIQPLPRATSVQVETPQKKRYRFDGNQPMHFVDTAQPGAYVVTQLTGNEEIGRRVYVATVLPPGRESVLADLTPRESVGNLSTISGPQPLPVVLGPGREQKDAEWWRLLGVAGLGMLLTEWWWFHR